MEKFKFTPEQGFRDGTAYPNPTKGDTEVREQLQRPLDQLKNYVNDMLEIIPTDEDLQQMVLNHEAIQKLREDLEYLEEHSNSYAEYDEETGNLQINTVKEVNVTLAGLNELTTKLNNSITQLSNPNLLINSDFRNPINQRGKTSYLSVCDGKWAKSYSIDRWFAQNGGRITVNSESITIDGENTTSVGILAYEIENYLPYDTYTFTINVLNNVGDANLAYYDKDNNEVYLTTNMVAGLNTFTFKNSIHSFAIAVGKGESLEIEYIKLEKGSVSTPFVPRHYGEELALCQRYYHIDQSTIVGYIGSSSKLYCRSDDILSMRTNPTVLNKPKVCLYINGQLYEYTPSSIEANKTTGEVVVNLGTTSLSNTTIGGYFVEKLLFDAEIY